MFSLIIPVFNEEGAVDDIIRRSDNVLHGDYEIIVIDDGSTDATPGILKRMDIPSMRVIRHYKNEGNGSAIMTGLREATGEWIGTIDADDTYRPEDLPRLLLKVQAENADMIVGVREGLRHGRFTHRLAREMVRKLAEVVSGSKIPDINSGLRIARRELVMHYIDLYPKRFSLHVVLMTCACRNGATILYEPVGYGPRIGVSKLSPGLRGVWNFLKFLSLILWTFVRRIRK